MLTFTSYPANKHTETMLFKLHLHWAVHVSRMGDMPVNNHGICKPVHWPSWQRGAPRNIQRLLGKVPRPLTLNTTSEQHNSWSYCLVTASQPSHLLIRNHSNDQRRREMKKAPITSCTHDSDVQPPRPDLPVVYRMHQPSACLHLTRTSSFMNLRSKSVARNELM